MSREDRAAVDRDSLEALVRAHQAEVYTYIHYLGAPHDVAEDIAQETFLWRSGSHCHLTCWMGRGRGPG